MARWSGRRSGLAAVVGGLVGAVGLVAAAVGLQVSSDVPEDARTAGGERAAGTERALARPDPDRPDDPDRGDGLDRYRRADSHDARAGTAKEDGPGRAVQVPCDQDELIAALVRADANGGGTLELALACTYALTAHEAGTGLPMITQPITIDGNGSTIVRAGNAADFRIFEVAAGGDLRLRDLTVRGGAATAPPPPGPSHEFRPTRGPAFRRAAPSSVCHRTRNGGRSRCRGGRERVG
ncbi:hypothetical protein [Actinopolymorpha pittospori]|uniref:Uncharacterized protein n=1 Tax=Actinopolymorpha pittospori TaxID=648752 RepID=A0A927N4J1_9ACTN|nr:hypothetical protein [Actinopolymorpha pittospori]MBE1612221.1 hypothetical protein [Actinopolymorpha pittospori]